MIVNLPSAERLSEIALRHYFDAWRSVVSVDIDASWIDSSYLDDDQQREFLEAAQIEIDAIVTKIQLANEIALKARVCEVSPFLLLLGSDRKFSERSKDYDFADFRTIDSIDLPAVVNSISVKPLSDRFIQAYHQLRSERNRFLHIGSVGKKFDVRSMVELLIDQYIELWPDRKWISDRLAYQSKILHSIHYDYKHYTPHSDVIEEVGIVDDNTSPKYFKRIFGVVKSRRRYRCHACLDDAGRDFPENARTKHFTATLGADGSTVSCFICLKSYPVTRVGCKVSGCKSNVIAVASEWYDTLCHICGFDQQDEPGEPIRPDSGTLPPDDPFP